MNKKLSEYSIKDKALLCFNLEIMEDGSDFPEYDKDRICKEYIDMTDEEIEEVFALFYYDEIREELEFEEEENE